VLFGQGLESDDIADRLSISEHTVRTHLQNVHRKLNVHSRLEIVRLVARHGLLEASEE
jgi:LuxR family transcriptional regulator of csgAB operon